MPFVVVVDGSWYLGRASIAAVSAFFLETRTFTDVPSSVEAELKAVLLGIELAEAHSILPVEIRTDCVAATLKYAPRHPNRFPSQQAARLQLERKIAEHNGKLRVKKVPRADTKEAHRLADKAFIAEFGKRPPGPRSVPPYTTKPTVLKKAVPPAATTLCLLCYEPYDSQQYKNCPICYSHDLT